MSRVAAGPRDVGSPAKRTPTAAGRRRRAAAAALGLSLGLLGPTTTPWAAAPEAGQRRADPSETPRDPNELPPLRGPEGQPAPDSLRRDIDHGSNASRRRRIWVNAAPVYASFRLPFLGRPNVPVRGGGIALSAQVPVWRPFGLRLIGSHTIHAAYDEYVRDDDDAIVQSAARGMIQGTHGGLSATYTMDLGRVVTSLDAGAGAMWIRSPEAVQDGQLGGTCRSEGVCDTGLFCSAAENVCKVGITPHVHGGFAVDVLIGDHFSVGGELRYYALLSTPTSYPVYLVAALRAGLRF